MHSIQIKVSERMTEYSGMYKNENMMLRVPAVVRQHLNMSVGETVQLNTNGGGHIGLTIGTAYKADVDEDDKTCYVTEQIFKLINVENTGQYQIEPINGITLGCDPEFFLVDRVTEKLLRAPMFFNKWGEIGNDGVLAELRPAPSLTPQGLTDNIYQLICSARNILNSNTVYDPTRIMLFGASSYQTATAGFHLHFGLPKSILGKNPGNVLLMHKIARVMDYFIGLPAIMLEGEHDTARRSNVYVNHGKPSDFRLDNRTLEYRVAGGSLLRHPILTRGLIALGEVVTQDVTSRVKAATSGFRDMYWTQSDGRFRDMYPNVISTPDAYSLICSPSIVAARTHLGEIYEGIKNMMGYERRREEIDELFSHIVNNIQYNNDIEYNWRNFYEQHELHQSRCAGAAVSTGS